MPFTTCSKECIHFKNWAIWSKSIANILSSRELFLYIFISIYPTVQIFKLMQILQTFPENALLNML